MILILLCIFAYLMGSIPFGLIISKLMLGIDVRQSGSGNIGMTNVMRVGGRLPGLLTFVADFSKGFLPVYLVVLLQVDASELWKSVVAIIAVLGHIFPVFLKFRGGKGVATTYGVLFALNWQIGIICAAVWILVFLKTRLSSLSALSMLTLLPFILFVGYWQNTLPISQVLLLSSLSLFIVYLHKDNISRLRQGREGKI